MDHLIGSPLALASKNYAAKAWTRFDEIHALRAPGVSWLQGTVVNVNCENKTALISDAETRIENEERYDFLVASSELRRAWPVVPQAPKKESYLCEVNDYIDKVRIAREGVVVVGGGMWHPSCLPCKLLKTERVLLELKLPQN